MKKHIPFILMMLVIAVSCNNRNQQRRLSQEETTAYIEKGSKIANASFNALAGELKAALARGGIEEAIEYCNVQALPLTDSLSDVYDVTIRRTTLKPRNPENEPSEFEHEILMGYKALYESGDSLRPSVHTIGDEEVLFTAPIMIKPLCLNCHGTVGQTVQQANYEIIKEHYPGDKATGYKMGDFRGMWSIRFNQE